MVTEITNAGSYPAGDYRLAANITVAGNGISFSGQARLDLYGYSIADTTSGNAWTTGVAFAAPGSILYDSKLSGKVTGFRVGVKFDGAGSFAAGVDLSRNKYMGAWLNADDCAIYGGRIDEIGGVTDEKYAIGVQAPCARPVVSGVQFRNLYPQAGYTGSAAGEGLPVNFAATCVGGVMRGCVAVNDVPKTNTYGVFGGMGGGHTIEDNLFTNFWRAAAVNAAGAPIVRGNFAWLHAPLVGSQGFSCSDDGVSNNVAIGYDAPFSVANLGKNISVFVPVVAAQEPPPPTISVDGEVLSATLVGAFGNVDAKTVKCRIKSSAMAPPAGSVTKIRLTLKGHADEPLVLAKCYIGKRNSVGDACDAVSLAPLQVAGASAFTIPAGGQVTTDWLPFFWNKIDDFVVSIYANGGPTADKLAAAVGSPAGDTYLKSGDEAAIADASGFAEYIGYLSLVTKIETDGF